MTSPLDDFSDKEVIKKIKDSIEQPDKFAEIFCEAARKQKSIDTTLKNIILHSIKNDSDTRAELKAMIIEIEREEWRAFVRKFGFGIWSVVIFFGGIVVTEIIHKIIH